MSNEKKWLAVAEALTAQQLEALHKLEGQYEKALGKLAKRLSLLHMLLEHFSWEAWNLNTRVGSVLTRNLQLSQLADKLEESAEHIIPEAGKRKQFISILRKVKQVASTRNEYLHSIWFIRNGEPVFYVSRKRGMLVGPDAPSVEEINELTSKVLKLRASFDDFRENNPLGRTGLFGMS